MNTGRLTVNLKQIYKVILSLVLFASWSSQVASQDKSALPTEEIDRIVLELMDEYGAPGMSVAVACDNRLLYSRGYGLADVEHSVPTTEATRYRTASIAKPMTAAVVLSLMEEGKLDLDAEVQHYVPEFPEKRWPVSVRQLLGHLGGIRHYKSSDESSSTAHFFNLKSALSTFADDPLIHEPGTKYRYSSFGYNLLGSVAEGAGAANFMSLLKQRVLDPAGMAHTVADDSFARLRFTESI